MQGLPTLSHLLFQTLWVMGGETWTGFDLRGELERRGLKRSQPAFHLLMERMVRNGLVNKDSKMHSWGKSRSCVYRATAKAAKLMKESHEFYRERANDEVQR